MKERGIVVSPNVKPGMLLVHPLLDEMKEKNMFVLDSEKDEPGVGTWWGGKGIFVDFTKDETRKSWKEYLKKSLIDYVVSLFGMTTVSTIPWWTKTPECTLKVKAAPLAT